MQYRNQDDSLTTALDNVSFSISAGERVAIVGPNGSGKSTLALVVAGLMSPSSGEVTIDGRRVDEPAGALVFQHPDDNLIGATVEEEIILCLEQAVPHASLEDALSETLSRFNLQSLAGRPSGTLSGGEKQMIAVACASVSGRRLIVMDEPTSHLDPPGKRLLWHGIDALLHQSRPKPAIVVVTQYSGEVQHFDRIISLKNGEIVYDGPPSGWPASSSRILSMPTRAIETRAAPVLSLVAVSQSNDQVFGGPQFRLRDVSLELHSSEAVAMCGPIGAGKTSLAMIMAGLTNNFTGERKAERPSPVYLMQFPERQMFCRTVEEEVAIGLLSSGISRDLAISRSRSALEDVGLDPKVFAERSPFSLSGGQKRRVMLAAASVLNPPVYILDEPQAALDEEGIELLGKLTRLWIDRHSACVVISHDLAMLRTLTARVWLLNRGELVYDGTWNGLESQPNLLSDIGFQQL